MRGGPRGVNHIVARLRDVSRVDALALFEIFQRTQRNAHKVAIAQRRSTQCTHSRMGGSEGIYREDVGDIGHSSPTVAIIETYGQDLESPREG